MPGRLQNSDPKYARFRWRRCQPCIHYAAFAGSQFRRPLLQSMMYTIPECPIRRHPGPRRPPGDAVDPVCPRSSKTNGSRWLSDSNSLDTEAGSSRTVLGRLKVVKSCAHGISILSAREVAFGENDRGRRLTGDEVHKRRFCANDGGVGPGWPSTFVNRGSSRGLARLPWTDAVSDRLELSHRSITDAAA